MITSTHEPGHTLDLIVTRHDDVNLITGVRARTAGKSEHQLVACRLSLSRDNKTRVTYTYRNIQSIDVNVFCNCVRASRLYDDDVLSMFTVGEYAELINFKTLRILDNIAPLKTRTMRQPRNGCRWQTEPTRTAMRNCRKLERRYLRTRSEQDKRAYGAA